MDYHDNLRNVSLSSAAFIATEIRPKFPSTLSRSIEEYSKRVFLYSQHSFLNMTCDGVVSTPCLHRSAGTPLYKHNSQEGQRCTTIDVPRAHRKLCDRFATDLRQICKLSLLRIRIPAVGFAENIPVNVDLLYQAQEGWVDIMHWFSQSEMIPITHAAVLNTLQSSP